MDSPTPSAPAIEVVDLIKYAADIRWLELAQGSPYGMVDRQMLSELYALAQRALPHATLIETQGKEIERWKDEYLAAMREVSFWASMAGEAKGKLEGSELAGVVEGWKERALAAESKLSAPRQLEILRDPQLVHLNMLRGGIAKLTPAQIGHLYRGAEACAVIDELLRQNRDVAPSSAAQVPGASSRDEKENPDHQRAEP